MLTRRPEAVIRLDSGQRGFQPCAVWRFAIGTQNHASQKRRLRAREKVRPVGVEDRSVVLDFVDEVVHHVARKTALAVTKQADLDEVAVPPIHLVESAARNDVGTREIQKPVFANALRIRRQRSQLDGREFFLRQHLANLSRHAVAILLHRHVHGPWRAGLSRQLRILRCRREIAVGAGQGRPRRLDVLPDFGKLRGRWQSGLPSVERDQDEEERRECPDRSCAVRPRHDWLIGNMFHGATRVNQETTAGEPKDQRRWNTPLELL